LKGNVKVTKGLTAMCSGLVSRRWAAKGSNKIKVIDEADNDEVMAWKNGRFQFSNMDMKDHYAANWRGWYDVDVVFEARRRRYASAFYP